MRNVELALLYSALDIADDLTVGIHVSLLVGCHQRLGARAQPKNRMKADPDVTANVHTHAHHG